MADETESMIIPLLREIRSDISDMKQKLDKLESGQKAILEALLVLRPSQNV